MLVLIVELRLSGVNHVLRVWILVVLDLLLGERISGLTRNPQSLVDRRLGLTRSRVDIADTRLLLGIDRGGEFARVCLIWSSCYALRLAEKLLIVSRSNRIWRCRTGLRAF